MVIEFNILFQNGLQQLSVIGLFFYGMGKEKVFFVREQRLDGYFFDAEQYIARFHVVGYFDACIGILVIGKDANRRRFYHDVGVGVGFQDFLTGLRRQHYTAIWRVFAFAYDSEGYFGHLVCILLKNKGNSSDRQSFC